MAKQIKYTKNELLDLQKKLVQFSRYLPTLQLKKALLQAEVNKTAEEVRRLQKRYKEKRDAASDFAHLLSDDSVTDLRTRVKIRETNIHYENIAGVEIPVFESVVFHSGDMPLMYQPVWVESMTGYIRDIVIEVQKVEITKQKLHVLQEELRTVSIRVNLFEKRLIPQTEDAISRIKVFLGDQDLAAVALAKVAKEKVLRRKEA